MISGLSEFKKKMGSLPQTLSRLLMLIKKEAISKEDLEAVVNLENHFEERLDRFNAKYGGDADSMVLEESLLISHAVNQVVGAKLGLTMVRQLFCTVSLRNRIELRMGETENSNFLFLSNSSFTIAARLPLPIRTVSLAHFWTWWCP